jgi:hypothetical protein
LQVDPNDDRPFGQANKDSQNPGALRDDGSRIPPSYVSHPMLMTTYTLMLLKSYP